MNSEPLHSPTISYQRSTSQQLFEYLRDEIISMELLPGEKIPENQLADKFGVSRTPVREALAKLSAQGFVEIRPQRGTFVTKLSMQHILEARFIRESVEVAVATHLAANVSDSVIAQCEEIIKAQRKAAEKKDALAFQRLDDQFHFALANGTGYERVSKVVEAEKAHMDRVRNLSLIELTGQYEHVLDQHLAILDAIKSRSAEAAKVAMQTHMQEVFKILKIAPKHHPEYFL